MKGAQFLDLLDEDLDATFEPNRNRRKTKMRRRTLKEAKYGQNRKDIEQLVIDPDNLADEHSVKSTNSRTKKNHRRKNR